MNKINVSRIERFRQLKSTIRNNNSVLIVGIDVSKSSSVACITDSFKEIYLKKFKFNNTMDGINALINKSVEIKQLHCKNDIIFAMEPTGNYHKPIASYILNKGFNVVGVSSVAAKENRKSLDGRWKKNDPRDAYNITDLLSQGKIFFYRDDEYSEILKNLLKLRQSLTRKLTSIKVRLRNNHFALYFPEFEQLYTDILHEEVLLLLEHFPTAEDVRNRSFEQVFSVLLKKPFTRCKKQRIYEIWSRAQNSIGKKKNENVDIDISLTLEQIKWLQLNIKKLNESILKFCSRYQDYHLLLTIPGFGPVLSALFLAYVGNINAYENPGQLTKLVGLDLEYVQSGKFHSQACISKKGSSLLRYALCNAAVKALNNKKLKPAFEAKLDKKGGSLSAKAKLRIKLADKLLRAAFVILKKQQPFNINYFLNPVESSLSLTNVGA